MMSKPAVKTRYYNSLSKRNCVFCDFLVMFSAIQSELFNSKGYHSETVQTLTEMFNFGYFND